MSGDDDIAEVYRIPRALAEDCPKGWPTGWSEERLGEPVLVLATRLNRRPRPTPAWHVIEHQTGGHACRHPIFWATRLSPTPQVVAGMAALEAEWFASNVGWHKLPSLNDALAYRDSLRRHFGEGFDCNRSYGRFNEAIYPIDCSKELLDRICTDPLPASFEEFFDDDFSGTVYYDQAELYVLGANSD